MSYIGQQLPADVFSGFTIDKFTGDGTANKALTLSKAPFSETTVLVTIDGVVQEPTDDFTVSGTTLTLVGTAANGSEINVTHLSGTVPSTLASKVDLNGVSDTLILDADADTTISADTDDQIDVKIGGTDALTVTGTALTGNALATIGAAGTASSIAGLPIYVDSSSNSVYTHDVSGTDNSADNNTAFGLNAADAITTADSVTVFGRSAGSAITTGSSSTFFGKEAGLAVTEGTNNIFMGVNAGHDVTTGGSNIAIGATAYDGCDTESHNLAIGRDALGGSVAGGEYNIAIGNYAGDALTSGDHNVFIGYSAGTDHTTASECVFIGHEAGFNATTATTNTAVGYRAIYENTTTGNENTCLGAFAGYRISSGASNTILGYDAGTLVTTGSNNICVGMDAGVAASPSGSISTGSDTICLGNNNISDFFCADTSISSSDKRDKTDITNFNTGLEWIEKLQPITYRWDKRTWYGTEEEPFGTPDGSKKRPRLHLGFLAQDVLEVEKSFGYAEKRDDMLTVNLTEDGMSYGMKYERLVTVLVNAVKELSTKVKALEEA
jgi:hypothetical protein